MAKRIRRSGKLLIQLQKEAKEIKLQKKTTEWMKRQVVRKKQPTGTTIVIKNNNQHGPIKMPFSPRST